MSIEEERRERIATAVLAALIASSRPMSSSLLASTAVRLADTLIEELESRAALAVAYNPEDGL